MEFLTVDSCEVLKGVAYPPGTRFRDIVVTGPPGGGKSTLVRQLGGWPEEGLIDLAENGWWRSRELAARPRQVHLALPFRGVATSLAVHDPEWNERASDLALSLSRIALPPERIRWGVDWRRRYLFEFLVPEAEQIFAARSDRADRRSHPIDLDLDLDRTRQQLEIYRAAAKTLHDNGFRVILRTEYGGPPKVFERHAPMGRASSGLMVRLWRRFAGYSQAPTLDSLDDQVLRGTMVRVPRDRLPVLADTGTQKVVIANERRFDGSSTGRLEIYDPSHLDRLFGRIRLTVGQATRLGRGAEDRILLRGPSPSSLPRLEILNQSEGALLVDLDSPKGTSVGPAEASRTDEILSLRRSAMERVGELLPPTGTILEPDAASRLLAEAIECSRLSSFRLRNRHGDPGGVVCLPEEVVPIVVGDLHTRAENLHGILSQNRFLAEIESGRAALVILGDAVHPEGGGSLTEMATSIAMMDQILALLVAFPQGVFYLLGNHDSFSPDVRKGSVPQGILWRDALRDARGEDYLRAMETFYTSSPYLLECPGLVACHGGPPTESVSHEALINIADSSRLRYQLTWNRLRAPNNPAGYTKRDVRKLLGVLGKPRASLVVSHTPPKGEHLYQRDLGGISGHHVIHSADRDAYCVATILNGEVALLDYDADLPKSK